MGHTLCVVYQSIVTGIIVCLIAQASRSVWEKKEKIFEKAHLEKRLKQVSFCHRIKPFQYVDKLKSTPCGQS